MRRLAASFSPASSSGAKKDARHLLHDEGVDHLLAFFGAFADGRGGVAPQQRIGPGKGRAHHAVADGLEDLREAKLGNEQAEGMPDGVMLRQHMGSGSGATRDQTHALQIQHGLGYGDARGVEELAQLRLARQTVAHLQRT